jgi:hypothetical protein
MKKHIYTYLITALIIALQACDRPVTKVAEYINTEDTLIESAFSEVDLEPEKKEIYHHPYDNFFSESNTDSWEDTVLSLFEKHKKGEEVILKTMTGADFDTSETEYHVKGYKYEVKKIITDIMTGEHSEANLFYNLWHNTIHMAEYTAGNDIYKISARFDISKENKSYDCILVEVFANNKRIKDLKSGKSQIDFSTCYDYYRNNFLEIKPIIHKAEAIGWLLISKSGCGNASSKALLYVIPSKQGYTYSIIDAKTEPVYQETDKGISLWYYMQVWGNGGTAASFFIPRKTDIILSGNQVQFKKGDIMKEIEFIRNCKDKNNYEIDAFSLFVAGMEDKNQALMEYAINIITEDENYRIWEFNEIGKNKNEIIKFKNDFISGKIAHDKIEYLVSW